MIRPRFAFLTVLFLLGLPVHAAELAGAILPDEAQLDGKTLFLNGIGLREVTIFRIDVYVAGLYLEKRSMEAQDIIDSSQYKRMVLHFVRDVDQEKIQGAWQESFKNNCGKECDALKDRFVQFRSMMPAAKEGDIIVVELVPGEVRIIGNGELMGEIEGDDFSRFLLTVWLGPVPPNQSLKTGLLGLTK